MNHVQIRVPLDWLEKKLEHSQLKKKNPKPNRKLRGQTATLLRPLEILTDRGRKGRKQSTWQK